MGVYLFSLTSATKLHFFLGVFLHFITGADTAHGFYKGKPKLDFERLTQLRDAVPIPLVLHGSSGVPDEDVQRAISLGVCKVNFATELRVAYTEATRQTLSGDPDLYDPKKFGGPGREAVTKLVRHRIAICGAGKRV